MEIESKPMKRMWVNVYRDEDGLEAPHFYDSEQAARHGIDKSGEYAIYLCTCPIEIPDLDDRGNREQK